MLVRRASLGVVALPPILPSPKRIQDSYLTKLGDASYGLDLLHVPMLVVLYGLLFPKIPGLLWVGGGKLSLFVYLVTTVGVSLVYFTYIEQPLHRISRRIPERIFTAAPQSVMPSK